MQMFTDRGTPYSYRHMNGYSGHTYVFYNKVRSNLFIYWTSFSHGHFRMEFKNMWKSMSRPTKASKISQTTRLLQWQVPIPITIPKIYMMLSIEAIGHHGPFMFNQWMLNKQSHIDGMCSTWLKYGRMQIFRYGNSEDLLWTVIHPITLSMLNKLPSLHHFWSQELLLVQIQVSESLVIVNLSRLTKQPSSPSKTF